MKEIAERAVKAKGWRWMAGMLPLALDSDGDWTASERVWRTQGGRLALPQGALPDLTDPATLGGLLAVVRDAHRDAFMAAGCDGEDWVVADCDGFEVSRGRSEREALVLALEVAS